MRFRKSFKIAPGVRATLGKKSGSISVGGKGMRLTKSTTGRTTTTVGIPGTGVAWTKSKSNKTPKAPRGQALPATIADTSAAPAPRRRRVTLKTVLIVLAVIVVLAILF